MKQSNFETTPIRVKFKVESWGEVVAFFPDFYKKERKIEGFCIDGGHFEADRNYYYKVRRKATKEEYTPTLNVLKNYYNYKNLKII